MLPSASRAPKANSSEIETQIEVAVEHRRQVLREGSANAAAAVRADRALANLKLLRARLLDQVVELLPALGHARGE